MMAIFTCHSNRLLLVRLLACWSLFWSQTLLAQYNTGSFDHISVEDGLSQSEVRTIYKDRQGFMWFGTVDGLNKYDGYNFKHYKHNPFDTASLSHNEVVTVLEDQRGNLWAGTVHGLNQLNRQTGRFERFTRQTGRPDSKKEAESQYITDLLEDRWGTLWVATRNGLERLVPRKNTSRKDQYVVRRFVNDSLDSKSLSNNSVRALYEDPSGTIWIGTGNGLNRLKIENPQAPPAHQRVWFENRWNSNSPIYQTTHPAIRAIVGDRFGTIWLGINDGLNRIDPQRGILTEHACPHSKTNPDTDDLTMDLLVDKHNELWVATSTNGVCKFTIGSRDSVTKTVHYKEAPFASKGLKSNLIYSLYESNDPNEDVVWIGTRGAGVQKFSRAKNTFTLWNRISNLDKSSGLNSTFAISADRHGLLWIGTVSGLVSIDRKTFKVQHFRHHPEDDFSISEDYICTIYEDRRGNLWIGTMNGLNLYQRDTRTFRRFYFANNLRRKTAENNIKVMYEDRQGRFWIGTMYDLKQFDPQTGKTVSYAYEPGNPHSLHESYITSIVEDHAGSLWVGTRFGLNHFDRNTERFTVYRHQSDNPKSLISSSVYHILKDRSGNLWISTDKGLDKMSIVNGKPQFSHYTEKEGLSNNFVYGTLEDIHGNIWISTNLGLARLNPLTGQFKNYDVSDGLPNNEFNEGAFYRSREGELFFGGNSGVVSFNPASMQQNRHVPSIALTAFHKLQGPLDIDSILAASGAIRLNYWENYFSFDFVALDYTNPRKNQYAYKLEGVDENWVYSGNRHYASFTNISPGTYTFRVKGSNSEGVWNDQHEAAVRIVILPPFWKTWWFYLAVIASCVAAGKLFYDYRVHNRVNRLIELERVKLAENERVRKLAAEDLHDEFGNKLTRISLLTELIKARLNGHGSEVEDLLTKISDNSNQLYQGTKDFIWSINPENDSMYEVAVRLKDFGDDIFDKTNVRFNVSGISESLKPLMLSMGHSRHLMLLFKEAMSNALKHAEASEVTLHFSVRMGEVAISLADNGKGITKDREHAGYGLINIRSRTNKLQGKLEIASAAGTGTRISVTLSTAAVHPVKNAES